MWSTLPSRNEVLEEVNFIRAGEIDSLEGNIFKVYYAAAIHFVLYQLT